VSSAETKEEDFRRYLDPAILSRLARLDLKARLVVEGFISGLHKSPFHGFSVEFAQHRAYAPGDDTRHIDWKVFAKSDRFYIKQYEEETNLRAYILLDTSESMAYQSGPVTKLEYGSYVAASLAFLMLQQQDAVGLILFDHEIKKFIKESSHPSHIKLIVKCIEEAVPEEKTEVDAIFHDLAERISRRGLIILISDLFTDPERLLLGLRHFRHKRHEVIVFHLLDEYELTFPFQQLTRFKGLEGLPDVFTEPQALRRTYLAEMDRFLKTIKRGCRQHNVDYVPIRTSEHLDIALSAYLSARAAKTK